MQLLLLMCIGGAAGAQTVVEGTAFLAMQSGVTRRITARPVSLAPATFLDVVRAACAEPDTLRFPARRDWLRTRTTRLEGLIDSVATQAVRTDVDGRYRFTGVAPGQYVLYLVAFIGARQYRWLVPVTVGQRPVVLDLDNGRAFDTPLGDPFCSPPPP